MSIRTSRRKKLLGVALSAATLGATFTAFAPSAGATLNPASNDADIRVAPADPTDVQDQHAPIIFADAQSQPGADMQIVVANQWANNDRILLAVTNSEGTNCTGTDPVDGALAYASVPEHSVAGPYGTGALLQNQSLAGAIVGGDPLSAPVDDDSTAPVINVSLTSSTSCVGSATDIIELRFVGESTPGNDPSDIWVVTLTGITYDVAVDVPAGPVRNVPYGEDSTGALTWAPTNAYGGNISPGGPHGAPAGIGSTNFWTNSAFVSPVKAAVGSPSQLINDGTRQALGTVTISEIQADAFRHDGTDDTITLDFIGLNGMNAAPDPVVTLADKAGAQITNVNWVDGNTLDITYNIPAAPPAEVLGSITIDGLFAFPSGGTGPVDLIIESPYFNTEFFTPDDQGGPPNSNSWISDVEDGGPIVVENFATKINTGTRIGGNDRYETAAALQDWNGCHNHVIVASGEDYADALSANYLAGALSWRHGGDVSILLTRSNDLPAVTATALRNMGARNVYVIGGPNAVSDSVFSDLESRTAYFCGGIAQLSNTQLNVVRLAGANRYVTNNLVTEFAAQQEFFNEGRRTIQTEFGAAGKNTALLATGTNFADALTAGPLAVEGLPLILTAPDALSPQALQALNSLDVDQVIVLGGTSAVSQSVEDAVAASGRETFRIAGDNRFETANDIADFARTSSFPTEDTGNDYDAGLGFGSSTVYLSNGFSFADALAGGPSAAYSGRNIVLTEADALNPTTEEWLVDNKDDLNLVRALGLGAAVSTAALQAANAAIG